MILASLADGPKHGHAVRRDIEGFSSIQVGSGTLYEALGRLEAKGLVAALPERDRRRPYQLTARGLAVLEEQMRKVGLVAETGRRRLRLPPA